MVFLRAAYRLTWWFGLVLIPLTALAYGSRAALGLFSGLLWSVVNAWVIEHLTHRLTSSERQPLIRTVILWTVKVPLLYGVCALLIVSPWSSPTAFLVGFSLWFVALMLGAIRAVAV